jgi:hypothetical protein
MSIDSLTDAPVAAIAALARGAIQADLGADVLVAVYEDPRNLFTIPDAKLPALCVHRSSERTRRQSSTRLVDDIVIGFEYALPSTSVDGRAGRWPTLAAVWQSLSRAVLAGKHSAVSSGADVLLAAGVWADGEDARVLQYTLVEGGRDSEPDMRARHPIFIAQIAVTHTPSEVNVATLNDFLRFNMTFDEPGGDGTSPLIVLNVILPT